MSAKSELSRFTVSVMAVEVFSFCPASGVCFSTFHFLSWPLVSGVTVMVLNPAFSRVVLASDTVWPTVLGMGFDGVNMYPMTPMASRTMMVRPHQRLYHGFFALCGFPPLPPPYGVLPERMAASLRQAVLWAFAVSAWRPAAASASHGRPAWVPVLVVCSLSCSFFSSSLTACRV